MPPRALLLAALIAPLAHAGPEQPAEAHKGWEQSGDILQWAVPLAGLGLSLLLTPGNGVAEGFNLSASAPLPSTASALNWPGPRLGGSRTRDFAVAFARMELLTYGLKYGINAKRPNGESGQSFPSGHTASAFMGAEFMRKNYGPWWGVPAYLAAAWVGYTRVESHNHYWRDVAGGALVGIAANYDFDTVATPVGALHIGPALWMPQTQFSGFANADGGLPLAAQKPMAGLRFEIRF